MNKLNDIFQSFDNILIMISIIEYLLKKFPKLTFYFSAD